jgi:hypothetical protein
MAMRTLHPRSIQQRTMILIHTPCTGIAIISLPTERTSV